jgi:hypothetical protein
MMQTTLVDRVDKLVQTQKSNLLATTPTTVAVSELATRVDSLERAVREIALEVEKLAGREPALLEEPAARRFSRRSI